MLGLLVAVLVLVVLLAGTAFMMRDKVKGIVLNEINYQLLVPLQVNGTIDFSLLQNFPFASVTLNDIEIKNKLDKGPKNLLKVKKLGLLFNMYGLLSNNIQISRINVSDGEFNLFVDAKGNADYEVLKPSTEKDTSAKKSAPLNLDIKKATVKNLKFTYQSEGKQEDVNLLIEKYTLSGNLKDNRFDLSTKGTMMIELIRLSGSDYVTKKLFSSDIVIDVDQKTNNFKLSKGKIEINKNAFDVEGNFIGSKKNTYVNFIAEANGKDIENLIALVPLKFKSRLEGAGGSGGYNVKAKIVGNIRANINPDIHVTAVLTKAKINIPALEKPLENVTAEGFYHMDSVGKDELLIKKFHSEFDGYPQDFTLHLTNLSNPDFVFNADGVADLHALRILFADSTLRAHGQVEFKKFHIAASKADFDDGNYSKIDASGNFTLKNVEIRYGGITYGSINGSLNYSDADISINGLTVTLLKTTAKFDGRITNIIGYALSQNNRTSNIVDQPLGINGTLAVKDLNVSRIIAGFTKSSQSLKAAAAAKPDAQAKEAVDPRDVFNMKGHLNISIDRFTYNKIVLDNLNADLGISPYRLDINSLTTNAMGGSVADTSYIAFTADRNMIFTLGLHIDKVDLPTLFKQCDNFSQTTLTDKNLKGRLIADVDLKTVWKNYTDINLDKLEGAVNCSVLHGELNNFEPLRAASKFIKMDDLNHIVFSDLTNQLTIKDKVINIPLMEVQSSALNLIMAGTHTLSNQIDYKIKVNLRKLLAAKFGRKKDDDAYIEENPYEGINLYLSIEGDIANPKIKLDRKGVKAKLKTDLADQKKELKELFGKEKKHRKRNEDEIKREEKYYDTRKKPDFIDFQEDTAK